MTLERLLGLINTDGSFYLVFKADKTMPIGYRINPVLQISQKLHCVFLLQQCKDFFGKNGIKSKISGLYDSSDTSKNPTIEHLALKWKVSCK